MNTDPRQPLRVWALLGPHRGDNNQILALAEAIGIGFEEKWLRYNVLKRLQPALLGATFKSVILEDRAVLEGPPPDLTISTGHRSVPVVRELRRRSGGAMRAVHLGYPRISPAHFDLVVPTPEYPVADAQNVIRVPFALSPLRSKAVRADPGQGIPRSLPSPRRLFVLGGPTLYWELPVDQMLTAARRLLAVSSKDGGSLLLIGSPRTPPLLLDSIVSEVERSDVATLIAPSEGSPSYAELIEAADEIYITADSVAMVADAVNTGKPVGLIPIAKSPLGRIATAIFDRMRPGKRLYPRDLRFFWEALEERGFCGTIENPRASAPPDFTGSIASQVRLLLDLPSPPATGDPDTAR